MRLKLRLEDRRRMARPPGRCRLAGTATNAGARDEGGLTPLEERGVTIMGIRDGQIAWGRLYLEDKSLISEAAIPWLPDPSRCADLSAVDGRALTEMLREEIIIERHPSKIDKDGRRHYLIRAIPYQDPDLEEERLKAVHEVRVKIVARV